MITFILFLLSLMAILGWTLAGVHARERDEAVRALENKPISPCEKYPEECDEDEHTVGDHLDILDDRISSLENIAYPAIERGRGLKEQVDHLAKVQMLILQDMKKEHQIQPQKDVLVTIGNLSDFKNKRERSA